MLFKIQYIINCNLSYQNHKVQNLMNLELLCAYRGYDLSASPVLHMHRACHMNRVYAFQRNLNLPTSHEKGLCL